MNDNEFLAKVRVEMLALGNDRGIPNEGDQFAIWFATEIMKEDITGVIDEYHIGGAGDNRVDIGICDEDHEVRIVVQCKFSQTPLSSTFNNDLIDEVLSAKSRLATIPGVGNSRRQIFARNFNQSNRPQRLVAVGFGSFVPTTIAYAETNAVEVYDFEKIKKRYAILNAPGGQRPPDLLTFEIPNGKVVDKGENYKLVSFLADAKRIWNAVSKYGDSLFQENLRYRLEGAAKSKIGNEIETTVKATPRLLDLLNNGITIVARRVEENDTEVNVFDPQIVNGGQTCWAIHDALEDLRMARTIDSANPLIPIKAIQTSDRGLILRITSATNTQNAISHRDKRSPDPLQQELSTAFDRFTPRILYEHRGGLFGTIDRQRQSSAYRISGRTYRRVSNELCGQLYLALMGLPNKSKAAKQMIMANDDFYNTIYQFGRSADVRYRNDVLGITPQSVKLRSGTSSIFVEDILFAHGVHSLAHAIGQLYRKKVELFDTEEKRGTNTFASLLDYDFMTGWDYYVVAAANYIVERLTQNDEDRPRIRNALVGTNLNRHWQNLQGEFKMNQDLNSFVVLDETNPSANFPLFAKWVIQIGYMLSQIVTDLKSRNEWQSTRHFLDLTDATYANLLSRLDRVLGGPRIQRNQIFPRPV